MAKITTVHKRRSGSGLSEGTIDKGAEDHTIPLKTQEEVVSDSRGGDKPNIDLKGSECR